MSTVYQFPRIAIFKHGEMDLDSMKRLTNFSCSGSIHEQPNTASMSFKLASYKRPGIKETHEFIDDQDRCTLWQSMDEIEVWMASEVKGGDIVYYPVFWGVATNVTPIYDDGRFNVNVECSGMFEFLKISRLNVNFDTAGNIQNLLKSGEQFAYTNKYSGQSTVELFKHIVESATTGEMLVSDFNWNSLYGPGGETNAQIESAYNEQNKKGEELRNKILKEQSAQAVEVVQKGRSIVNEETRKRIARNREAFVDYWKNSAFSRLKERLTFVGNEDVLSLLHPLEIEIRNNLNIDFYKGEFITRLQMAQDIASSIGYEFYQDMNGDVVLKPPMYNVPAVNAIYPEEIGSYSNPQLDLASMMTTVEVLGKFGRIKQFNDMFQFIVSSIYAPLYPDRKIEGDGNIDVLNLDLIDVSQEVTSYNDLADLWDESKHRYNVLQYGVRSPGVVNNPLLRTIEECEEYARWYFDKHNADVERKEVTLKALRPDIRLGYPILNYQDMSCWYVKRVSHTINPEGGTGSTTLSLQARRLPIWLKDSRYVVSVMPPEGGKFVTWQGYGSIGTDGSFQYGAALEDKNIDKFKQKNEDTDRIVLKPRTTKPDQTSE